jgi:hypothetical protein
MQITAPLALILGVIGASRDTRKGPAIVAAVIGTFVGAPMILLLVVRLANMLGMIG